LLTTLHHPHQLPAIPTRPKRPAGNGRALHSAAPWTEAGTVLGARLE